MKKKEQLEVVSIRLVKDAPLMSREPITTPEDAVNVIGNELSELDREVVCVINLNNQGMPINCNFAAVGTLNSCMITPREIFKSSILSNAASMIIVHNHPSGNLNPSSEDIIITKNMVKLCKLMGIPLLDHIIVGADNKKYYSFKENGIMEYSEKIHEKDVDINKSEFKMNETALSQQGKKFTKITKR